MPPKFLLMMTFVVVVDVYLGGFSFRARAYPILYPL